MRDARIILEKPGTVTAKVTVAVSLFNYEDYVVSALQSVEAQTLGPLDLIIVDDCSTDNSLEVVRDWLAGHGERFNRYLLLRHPANRGLARTRNTAFEYSESEYVFVLDADNLLFPRCLQALLGGIENSGASFAFSYLEKFGAVSDLGNLHPWNPSALRLGNRIDACALLRKSAWENAGGYSEDMPANGWEDFELWFKIAKNQGWGVQIPEILARYRVHERSMLHTETDLTPNKKKLWEYLKKKHREFFEIVTPPDQAYQRWITANEPGPTELAKQRQTRFSYSPRISIITPTYRTPREFLIEMIESVRSQTYSNWELCIADGGSPESYLGEILRGYSRRDPSIKVKFLSENRGIAGNSNEALALASGEFVGLLDHDDQLAPFALFEIVKALNRAPDIDCVYSDEDYLSPGLEARRHNPHFKPRWSPDHLRSTNYITHFVVFRKTLVRSLGGFKEGFDGAQDHELTLRVAERAGRIVHIPKVLYHWRMHYASTAGNPASKSYAYSAGTRAVQAHLQRIGLEGKVEQTGLAGCYRVTYALRERPKVSIVISHREEECHFLGRCVDSILGKSTYQNIEVLIVASIHNHRQTATLYEKSWRTEPVHVLEWHETFKDSAVNNFAAGKARGEVLLFLHEDVEVISRDWLEQMLQHALRRDAAAVGAKLYYPNGTVQHAGLVLGLRGAPAGHAFRAFPKNSPGYANRLQIVQNFTAVSGACLMTRKEVFTEAGGFEEEYVSSLGDADYCLKLRQRGYWIVWTPFAELYHHESRTDEAGERARWRRGNRQDRRLFRRRWTDGLTEGDAHYSPNLTLKREDFSIAPRSRA